MFCWANETVSALDKIKRQYILKPLRKRQYLQQSAYASDSHVLCPLNAFMQQFDYAAMIRGIVILVIGARILPRYVEYANHLFYSAR